MKRVSIGESFDDFRAAARGLLAAGAAPNEVVFEGQGESQLGLLDTASSASTQATALVPKTFIELAHVVALHRSPTRWPLLYEALFRITHGEHQLLADPTNALSLTLGRMKRSVTQDVHDMHAFVRFRRVEKEGLEHYIAWYEPEHRCLRLGAPHFQRRFAAMRWSILTPGESASWDLERLCYGPGVTRDAAPSDDELESLWKSYYASVFNPARLNVEAMTRQLPRRHWHNLPEAVLIPGMIKAAPRQTKSMLTGKAPSPSLALVPETTSLKKVSSAAHGCSICPWAKRSTQTVFGEGPPRTKVMMIGEQPGDKEDLEGHPFVGPAGDVLMRAMSEAGLPRDEVYLTNAVKHFKWTPDDRGTGKRRLHEKPSFTDVQNCFGWLETEIKMVKPTIIVLLGATAGQSLFGTTFRLVRSRGQFFETPFAPKVIATYHPSAVLRAVNDDARAATKKALHDDLTQVSREWRKLERAA